MTGRRCFGDLHCYYSNHPGHDVWSIAIAISVLAVVAALAVWRVKK